MKITIREVQTTDWDTILELAHQSAPWDVSDSNQQWLEHRKAFRGIRKHYVALDNETIIAYGAIEESPNQDEFRLFIVTHPENLYTPASDLLYEQLRRDLKSLKAKSIWTREYSKDLLNDYFITKGLNFVKRFTLEGYDEMQINAKDLTKGD